MNVKIASAKLYAFVYCWILCLCWLLSLIFDTVVTGSREQNVYYRECKSSVVTVETLLSLTQSQTRHLIYTETAAAVSIYGLSNGLHD
jgi:hypothetical protein